MAIRAFPVIFTLFLQAVAVGDVLVVDDNGGAGVDYTEVSAAVADAQEGDTILVKDGEYGGTSILVDGKSLTIIAENGAEAYVSDPFFIRNLSVLQAVTLRGLWFDGAAIDGCDGAVSLEDCILGGHAIEDLAALVVRESGRVTVNRCAVWGQVGATFWFQEPRPALHASNSSIAIYDTELYGGDGNSSPYSQDQDAATAAIMDGGFLFASGSLFLGGSVDTKRGGDGFWMRSQDPQLRTLETVFRGGSGQPRGEDLVIDSGSFEALIGSARHGWVQSPRRVGEPMSLSFQGKPGDVVMIHHNLRAGHLYLGYLRGVLLLNPVGLVSNLVGYVPATGKLDVTVPTPIIGGLEGISFFTQATFLDTAGQVTLGSPSLGVILDPSF